MSPRRFTDLFVSWLKGVHKTRIKTLAAMVYGLARSPRLGVAALGRALPGGTAEKHRIKRVDRFLGNERIRPDELVRPLIGAIIGTRQRIFVAIDWTDLHDGIHQALVAGVITGSRALPIWWRIVDKRDLAASQNRIEEQFIATLRRLLPRDREAVILADRGFARVGFLQQLQRLGFRYVIRTKVTVWVEGERHRGTLGDLVIGLGTLLDLGVVNYQKNVGWPVRVVAHFAPGQREPWLLATNITEVSPSVVVRWYGRRMEVEELFKDLKNERAGFRLRGLALKSPLRYSRLFLLVAYAYYLLTVLGEWAENHNLHKRLMANTASKRTLGLWRVGYYIFRSLSRRRGRPPQVLGNWPDLAYAGT